MYVPVSACVRVCECVGVSIVRAQRYTAVDGFWRRWEKCVACDCVLVSVCGEGSAKHDNRIASIMQSVRLWLQLIAYQTVRERLCGGGGGLAIIDAY